MNDRIYFLFLGEKDCWMSADSFKNRPVRQLNWRSQIGELDFQHDYILVA
jgi:hypothetical protein